MTAYASMLARRSHSRVTDEAPSHAELLRLVEAAGQLADHSRLRPWRLIEIRGDARAKVGKALAKAKGASKSKYIAKTSRAPLMVAIVASIRKGKQPKWEQEAVAAGVAHNLSLLLDEAGWGVFWRTGDETRHRAVAKAHRLEKNEHLLGWLYVGGIAHQPRSAKKSRIDPEQHLSKL